MVARVRSSILFNGYFATQWQDAYRTVLATAVLGLSILLIAGCAEHDTTVYRTDDPMPQAQEPGPMATPVQEPSQATVSNAGPMTLGLQGSADMAGLPAKPESPAPVEPATVRNDPSRLAFLEWFGSAADRARVNSPTDELRKSRAFTAGQEQSPEVTARVPAPQQAFTISNNSRLVPTYADGLPERERTNGPLAPAELAGANITGSVSVPTKTAAVDPAIKRQPAAAKPQAKRDEAASANNAAREVSKNAESPLPAVENSRKAAEQRQAAVDPGPVDEIPAPISVPDRNNPIRLHIQRGMPGFNQQEQSVLADLAALQVKTGLNVHIRGVARGISGDTRKSGVRVRRLHGHAKRAIAVLAHHGVPRSKVTITTAEQRMTGIDLGTFSTADEDRLDFSLE